MANAEDQAVLYRAEGGVATVILNRPDRRNAVDSAARVLLAEAFARAEEDGAVRVVVLTGSGEAFCAGVDLKEAAADPGSGAHPFLDDPAPLAAPVASCRKPVVAAVNGAAIGGGFELALAADVRLASTTAVFALTEGRIGSIPGSGGTQRLFQSLPASVAWEMLFTGERLDAERAGRFGLVSRVCEPEALLAEASSVAARIAGCAPLSLRAIKLAGRAALEGTDGYRLERTLWALLAATEDRAEGRAAFREKREPRYRGR